MNLTTDEIAMEKNCEYAYLLASGIYSQAIFAKAGVDLIKLFYLLTTLQVWKKKVYNIDTSGLYYKSLRS
jgi:hypothetical protein